MFVTTCCTVEEESKSLPPPELIRSEEVMLVWPAALVPDDRDQSSQDLLQQNQIDFVELGPGHGCR